MYNDAKRNFSILVIHFLILFEMAVEKKKWHFIIAFFKTNYNLFYNIILFLSI